MEHLLNSNFQLVFASIALCISIVIAIGALIMCALFEWSCNRIEKENENKRKTLGFSDDVNECLEMTLDIKTVLLNSNGAGGR